MQLLLSRRLSDSGSNRCTRNGKVLMARLNYSHSLFEGNIRWLLKKWNWKQLFDRKWKRLRLCLHRIKNNKFNGIEQTVLLLVLLLLFFHDLNETCQTEFLMEGLNDSGKRKKLNKKKRKLFVIREMFNTSL